MRTYSQLLQLFVSLSCFIPIFYLCVYLLIRLLLFRKTTPKKAQAPAKKAPVAKKNTKVAAKKQVVVESDSDSDDYEIEEVGEFNFDNSDDSDDSDDERAALAEVDFENIVLGGDADDEDMDDEDDEDLEMNMDGT